MDVLYGGGFNPPTIAHYEIIKYLTKHFDKVIVMPTNNNYKNKMLASFDDRVKMLEAMTKDMGNVEVSRFEENDESYLGTAHTLKLLNHPLFVIGADQLALIHTWINATELVRDNHFIVFPRSGINREELLESEFLKDYKDNFVIVKDFKEINASSTAFRNNRDYSLVTDEVRVYIINNHLYEEA